MEKVSNLLLTKIQPIDGFFKLSIILRLEPLELTLVDSQKTKK